MNVKEKTKAKSFERFTCIDLYPIFQTKQKRNYLESIAFAFVRSEQYFNLQSHRAKVKLKAMSLQKIYCPVADLLFTSKVSPTNKKAYFSPELPKICLILKQFEFVGRDGLLHPASTNIVIYHLDQKKPNFVLIVGAESIF